MTSSSSSSAPDGIATTNLYTNDKRKEDPFNNNNNISIGKDTSPSSTYNNDNSIDFDRPWSCTACTLINTDTRAVECKVCQTIRPGVILGRGGRRLLSSRSPYYSNRSNSRGSDNLQEIEGSTEILSRVTFSSEKKKNPNRSRLKRKCVEDNDSDDLTESMEGKENKTSERRIGMVDSEKLERNRSTDGEDEVLRHGNSNLFDFEASLVESYQSNRNSKPERKNINGGEEKEGKQLEYDLESSDDDKVLKWGRLRKDEGTRKKDRESEDKLSEKHQDSNEVSLTRKEPNIGSSLQEQSTTFQSKEVPSLDEEDDNQALSLEHNREKETPKRLDNASHLEDVVRENVETIPTNILFDNHVSAAPTSNFRPDRKRITVDENIVIENDSSTDDEDCEVDFSSFSRGKRIDDKIDAKRRESDRIALQNENSTTTLENIKFNDKDTSHSDIGSFSIIKHQSELLKTHNQRKERKENEAKDIEKVEDTVSESKIKDGDNIVNNNLENLSASDCSDNSLEIYLRKKRSSSLQKRAKKRRVYMNSSDEDESHVETDHHHLKQGARNNASIGTSCIKVSGENNNINNNRTEIDTINGAPTNHNLYSNPLLSDDDSNFDFLSVNQKGKNEPGQSKGGPIDTISLGSSTSYSTSYSSSTFDSNNDGDPFVSIKPVHPNRKKDSISNKDLAILDNGFSSDSDSEIMFSSKKRGERKSNARAHVKTDSKSIRKSITQDYSTVKSSTTTLSTSHSAKKNKVIDLNHFGEEEEDDDDLSSLDSRIKSTSAKKRTQKTTKANRTKANVKDLERDELSAEEISLSDINEATKKNKLEIQDYDDIFDSEEKEESNNAMEIDSMQSSDISNYNISHDNKRADSNTALKKSSYTNFEGMEHYPYEDEDICDSFPSVSDDDASDYDFIDKKNKMGNLNQNWNSATKKNLNQVPPDFPDQLPHFRSWKQLKRYGQGGQTLSTTKKRISGGNAMSFILKNTDAQSSTIHTGVNYDLFLYASTEGNTNESAGKSMSKSSSNLTASRIGLSMDLYRRNGGSGSYANSTTDSLPLSYLAFASNSGNNNLRIGAGAIKDSEYEARKKKRLAKESQKKGSYSKRRRKRRTTRKKK